MTMANSIQEFAENQGAAVIAVSRARLSSRKQSRCFSEVLPLYLRCPRKRHGATKAAENRSLRDVLALVESEAEDFEYTRARDAVEYLDGDALDQFVASVVNTAEGVLPGIATSEGWQP